VNRTWSPLVLVSILMEGSDPVRRLNRCFSS
jgi:hypothetical protein